jgi:hypothetical protein
MIISIEYSFINGATYSVWNYGAYPSDNIDDTSAVQAAISAAITNGPNNIVMFQNGTYNFTSSVYIYNGINLTVIGQGEDITLILGTVPTSLFTIISSQGITISMLSIDFDPLPFTAGYVTSVSSSYLVMQVVPPHKADVGQQIEAILRYDVSLMRPATGPNAYEAYYTPTPTMNTSLVGNGTLRVPLGYTSSFVVGNAIIVRYAFVNHAFYVQDVPDFTLQSITLYTSWYMGIFTLRTPRLNIIDYHVKLSNGRWMSTSADCMHFADSREYINIFDSSCEAQGDDGLNVQGFYFQVSQVLNSTALIIQEYNWPETLNVGIGTHFEFSTNSQPFSVYNTATVATLTVYGSNSMLFTFVNPINASVNDWVCVSDTPVLTIRNLTVENNRARGVLLQTRNIYISQSLFNRTSGPAVLIQPSLYWHEGPGTQNTTLEYNMYISCNEGLANEKGMIALTPYPVQLVPVLFQIQIKSSTFINGQYSGNVIQCANAGDVLISNNYITTTNSTATILLCNTNNISAINNCINNNQSSNTLFYSYDSTNPCLNSLTSQISLNSSGFTSTFLPPVIATNSGIQLNFNPTSTIVTTTTTVTTSTVTTSAASTSTVTTITTISTVMTTLSSTVAIPTTVGNTGNTLRTSVSNIGCMSKHLIAIITLLNLFSRNTNVFY